MRRMRLIQATADILIPVNGKRLPGLTHRHHFHPVDIHMVWQRGDVEHLFGDILRAERRGATVQVIGCRLIAFGANQREFGFGNTRRRSVTRTPVPSKSQRRL
jgi:hypothetical protein